MMQIPLLVLSRLIQIRIMIMFMMMITMTMMMMTMMMMMMIRCSQRAPLCASHAGEGVMGGFPVGR